MSMDDNSKFSHRLTRINKGHTFLTRLIACIICIILLSTNVTSAADFKLALRSLVDDIVPAGMELMDADLVMKALVEEGVLDNEDLAGRGGDIRGRLAGVRLRGKGVSCGVLSSRSNPGDKAFYVVKRVREGGVLVHCYYPAEIAYNPILRILAPYLRGSITESPIGLGGKSFIRQTVIVPPEMLQYVSSVIALLPLQIEESPDITMYWFAEPHDSVNKNLENEHKRGNTYFIFRGGLYRIKFSRGEPVTDAQNRYELEQFEDKSLLDILNKINRARVLYEGRLDRLFTELSIPQEERQGLKGRFRDLKIPVFRGRFLLGEREGVVAHGSGTSKYGLRWGDQISFGELMIDFLPESDLAELMIEETKHVLFPEKHHSSAESPDGIKHDVDFRRRLSEKIAEYLLHLDEGKLRELYRRRKMHRLRGAPWLDLYLSSGIIKSRRLRSALEEVRREFDKPRYAQDRYFEVIESVFEKHFRPIESFKDGAYPEDIKELVQYYRAIDPRFGQNWDFVKEVVSGGSHIKTFLEYLKTARRLKIPFGQAVCGIVQCEEVQRPLDTASLRKLARAPPRRTRYAYIGGGGWTPTDFAWALARNRGIIENSPYSTMLTIITNTQDDGGRSRTLVDKIMDLWDIHVIAPGDGVVLAWLTGVVAKLDLLYRDGDFSRVVNINRLTKDAVDQKGRRLVDLLYRPLAGVLDRRTYDRFIDNLLEASGDVSPEGLEAFVKGKLAEAETGIPDMKKINSVWKGLKSQLKTDGPHILSVEDTIKDRIIEAERRIRGNRSIVFEGRDFGIYEEPHDWLYFLGNVMDMARMVDEELVRPEVSMLQNLSWMNAYTVIGQLDIGVIQPGNMKAGIPGRLVPEIGFRHFCDVFGIEHGYWAPSTFDQTTMATVMEGAAIRINNKTAVIGTDGNGNKVVGFVEIDSKGSVITTKIERLGDLSIIPRSPEGIAKRFGDEDVNFSVNGDGKVVIKLRSYEIVLDERQDREGRTSYILSDGPEVIVRTDARWHKIVEGIEVKSRLVEEQNRITDAEELHPSAVYKLIWKKIVKDKDGAPLTDQFGNRLYRDITMDEKPIADRTMLQILDNVDHLVFTGQSSLVTSTLPNYLIKGMINKLKELKKRGVPIIYMVKPMKDIETHGLTFGEQIRVWERSIQDFIGDSSFRISEILSGIVIPDLDALPEDVRKEFAEEARKKREEYPIKLPYTGPGKEYKLSKIIPMDPLDIGYGDREYPGKAVDMEVLEELRAHGVDVIRTPHLRVFMGKYVYDEEELIKWFEWVGFEAKSKRGRFEKVTDFINEFERMAAGLDPEKKQKITVAFSRGRYGMDIASWDIPLVTPETQPDEFNRAVEYLKYNIYNRLSVYGAERILIDAPVEVFQKLSEIFAAQPYSHIYSYLGMVYRSEFKIERAAQEDIAALRTSAVTEPEPVDYGDPRQGSYIGVDVGEAGIKIIVRRGDRYTLRKEYKWQPEGLTAPREYLKVITESIDDAIEKAGLAKDDLDGIGISWQGAVVSGDITGRAMIDKGLTKGQFRTGITPLREFITLRYKVPVSVVNNGDAVALYESVDGGFKNVVCLSLDERLAGSYVDKRGRLTSWLNELGNVVIDTHPGAARHLLSRVKGTLQKYLSQEGVFRLAELEGINLFGIAEGDRLNYIQGLLNSDNPELVAKARDIFKMIGEYLAVSIAVLYPVYHMEHVAISGRCVREEAGRCILESARDMLARKYPEVNVAIHLSPGDERTQDYANAIGASYSAFQEAVKVRRYVVAIDGPAGVGKGTVAKEIARRLRLVYLDTGGIYRAITYYLLQRGIIHEDETEFGEAKLAEINRALEGMNLDVRLERGVNRFIVNGSDVTSLLRAVQISRLVPQIAKISAVRDKSNVLQRAIAGDKGIIVDGRDTAIVFPDADRKIYLYATPKVRADRRYDQLRGAGEDVDYSRVFEDMMRRDETDMARPIAPLMRPEEARERGDILFFDNSQLNPEETIGKLLDLILLGREERPPPEARRHSGAVSETGRTLTTVTIDESGNIVGEYEGIPDKGLLMELLRRLIELYGPGILGVTKEIEIVEGDSLSFYNTKVQIGINRFRSRAELFEGLEHEFLESVTTLIQPNKGYGETTILYRNIKRFLNPPEGFDKAEYQGAILRGFSEGYRRVLERLLELEGEGRLTDSIIISSIVRYIIGTGLYTEEDFGMDRATWIETVKRTETRLEAALEVYDELIGAKGGERIKEKVEKQVRRTERAVLRRIKTFNGKVRIGGLERLPQAIVRAVDVIGEISGNTAAIQAEALRLIDAKEKKPQKYIWLDKAKEDVLTGSLRTEWERIKEELQRRGFAFVYNKPDGAARGDIIRLVDPSDLDRLEKDTDTLYLSIPYMRASLYIAAEVVLAEGNVDSLMGSLSIRLITELYEQLLGREVTRDDLIRLFTQPWYILPEIGGIIGELNCLDDAAVLFEAAA